jgi:hypothetical protein
MKLEDLNRLEALDKAATPGPWYVRQLDDDMCQGAVAISCKPDDGMVPSMRAGNWPGHEIIAACLIQSPPYAVVDDDKFEDNAELIAAIRNCLPELLLFARAALTP